MSEVHHLPVTEKVMKRGIESLMQTDQLMMYRDLVDQLEKTLVFVQDKESAVHNSLLLINKFKDL